MSNAISRHLVKAIADMAIFLEFTKEELLNADTSIEAMEQLAMELQLMENEDRCNLALQLKDLSAEYGDARRAQFVENLPESLGLE
ncbi:hypothetical protein [Quatrionicoccus australiensis]|uniref:hypothetical protein n=1 Tax=Quatrionicoccus australiensis TaxID=138118 RepID=UPI001CF81BD5|nr:hypothetical protein [Quatrionicoccus australiensis]UCV14768.1 hypothetical protein KI612_17890 [Quatrionicoccus australiensis]UCV14771.1 hypothetical protein KI612_17910 [Quatrionicoccus australiensis]